MTALLSDRGYHWPSDPSAPPTISYSFLTADPDVYPEFRAFTEVERGAARQALEEWAKVANIDFVEVATGGKLEFAAGDLGNAVGMTRWWSIPQGGQGTEIVSAQTWIDRAAPLDFEAGGSGARVLLHELGHALGLRHPFERNALSTDTERDTVMAYAGHPTMPGIHADSPMPDDIAAIQNLYGANPNTATGDTVYRWDDNPTFIHTIYDAGGDDTIDLSNLSRAATVDLRPGAYSSVGSYGGGAATDNLAIAEGTVIENVVGTARADTLTGNDAANVLAGGGGGDLLRGGAGADLFVFTTPADGGDRIADFAPGDRLAVGADAFGLAAGPLADAAFAALGAAYHGNDGAGAAWAAGRPAFLYDATGALYYDANGAAPGQTLLASLPAGAALDAGDITVIDPATILADWMA